MDRRRASLSFMLPLTSEEQLLPVESLPPNHDEVESHLSPSDSVSEDTTAFDPDIFEKLLQHECHRWQAKLRLQDWNVHVTLCRLNEMPGKDALAAIFPSIERKDALMRVLSPLDVPLVAEHFQCNEEINYGLTLVHELLHLHFWGFTQNQTDVELVAEEQAVNALSRCIVSAYAHKIKPLTSSSKVSSVGHYL